MPVVRNPQYYFKEGFCWTDINTTFLKCRLKQKSINDVKSMSLYSINNTVSEFFLICLINSKFISYYVNTFVNNTQTFQINDARQLPILIPNKEKLIDLKRLFDSAIKLKKEHRIDNVSNITSSDKLHELQIELDLKINALYLDV